MSERLRVILSYLIVCTVWGSSWLAIKVTIETIPPLLGASLRFLSAGLILAVIVYLRKISIPFDSRSHKLYLTISLTSFAVPFSLVYWGEQYVSSGLAAILFATFPFSVAMFSYFFLPNEKLTPPKIFGMLVSFVGICVIFAKDIAIGNQQTIFGMFAIIGSAMLQGYSAIVVKKHGGNLSSLATIFIPTLYSGVFLLIASILVENYSTIQFTTSSTIAILYLALFATVLTFISYYWLLKRVQAVMLSLTAFITPIVAVVLGMLLLKETLASQTYFGALCVLCGILIANSKGIVEMLNKTKN